MRQILTDQTGANPSNPRDRGASARVSARPLGATLRTAPATLRVVLATVRTIFAAVRTIPATLRTVSATLRTVSATLRTISATLRIVSATQRIVSATQQIVHRGTRKVLRKRVLCDGYHSMMISPHGRGAWSSSGRHPLIDLQHSVQLAILFLTCQNCVAQ